MQMENANWETQGEELHNKNSDPKQKLRNIE